jgi:hypothetical protein
VCPVVHGRSDTAGSETNGPTSIPFQYFKELRRLNESLHVRDDTFHEALRPPGVLTVR